MTNLADLQSVSHALSQEPLPRYDLLDPKTIPGAVDALIEAGQKALETAVAATTPETWSDAIAPLNDAMEQLNRAWSAVHHLGAVVDSPEWRDCTNSRLEAVSRFSASVTQDERLYEKLKRVASAADVTGNPAREQAVAHALRDFRLGGAELAESQKTAFADQSARLAQLAQRFSEQLLDSTNASTVHITDEARLSGLPAHALAAAKAEAERKSLEGWVFTLQAPSLTAVQQFADDRALRENLYRMNAKKASELAEEGPDHDNTPIMGEILAIRQAQAKTLGFSHAAQVSLEPKMASSAEEVQRFLRELAGKARPSAERDLSELRAFAKTTLHLDPLEPWDIAYASEKLRQARYSFSEDEVRQYFPLPNVLRGLFGVIHKLFGVDISPLIGLAPSPAWHPDVQMFQVRRDGSTIGYFFLDLYARSTKRGGAWMDDSRGRKLRAGRLQLPIALMTCNFAAPVDERPTTLTHDEVITLFHEFGHGLHHLLTEVDELDVSGINGVEWDAVELPSQFMENFCWEWETLSHMTAHIDSGESLPRALFDKMVAAKNFQSGLFTLRQIEFGLFDMRIHAELSTLTGQEPQAAGQEIMRVLQEVRDEVAVIKPPSYNRFPQSFGHIFGGGYAAGYYSYKWAEVLSADAYAAFEEAGPEQYQAVGLRFWREILSRGGSRPAMENFKAFRGREPSIEPLLRHSGLLQAA
jgi:oligopeptidase A